MSMCPRKGTYANFLACSLCGMEDKHRIQLQKGIYRKKKILNQKQAKVVQPVSLKMGLGNCCPMPNNYDVVPQVMRISRNN